MVIEATAIIGSAKGLIYQANDKNQAMEICRNGLIGDDPQEWHLQMRNCESINSRLRVQNKRISVVIAPSKEVSGNLTIEECNLLVLDYLDKMKIDKENHQYIAHFHNSTDDKHIHLTISRINMYGFNKINDSLIGVKSGTIADKMAKERGWRTAKEISQSKKDEIGIAVRSALKTATNFQNLSEMMKNNGYTLNLSENEAKGIYGMRIIPTIDINQNPSERALRSKQGYKLSEIQRHVDRKATFRISDIKMILERNAFKIMSVQERNNYAHAKNERIFGIRNIDETSNHQSNLEPSKSQSESQNSIIEVIEELLKPSYTSTQSSDEIARKKFRKSIRNIL